MKYPYAVHRVTLSKGENTFDEAGNAKGWTEIIKNTAVFADCEKENCAAWQDGKCQYKS